jgi:hypothetical protein
VLLGHPGAGEVVHDDWVQPGGHGGCFFLNVEWSSFEHRLVEAVERCIEPVEMTTRGDE